MNAHYLNIETIIENRDSKSFSKEEINELITTLYGFSVLSYEAYNKRDTPHGEY